MVRLVKICFLLFVSQITLCKIGRDMKEYTTAPPKRYKIHLDGDLEKQYSDIFLDFKEPFKNFIDQLQNDDAVKDISMIGGYMAYYQDEGYQSQVELFSKITGCEKDVIIVANLALDIMCTSIVVNKDDSVFLARNLDFTPVDLLASMSYEVEAYINNKHYYTATNIFGLIGLINVNVIGKFTISINQRTTSNKILNAFRSYAGFYHPQYYMKIVAEKAQNYNEAFEMLQQENLSASVYFIISGIKRNEGAVIARDFNKPVLINRLSNQNWFLVQTNYDRNKADPDFDFRRIPAEKRILKLDEKNLNYTSIIDEILIKAPNNNEQTIFTSVQSASDSYFKTIVYHKISELNKE